MNSQTNYSHVMKNLIDGKTTSYKLFWLASILKEMKNLQTCISFKKLVLRMITISWYPIVKYQLNLGSIDMLQQLVLELSQTYNLSSNICEDDLLIFLERLQDEEIEKKISNLYRMVPYRLLTSFFSSELNGIIDAKKNNIIETLSNTSVTCFYKINSELKIITISPYWKTYILNNYDIIDGWLNYNIACFLQSRNPNICVSPLYITSKLKNN